MPDYQPIDYRLRCHTKRTDLPADVLRDIGEAYEEIGRLRKELDTRIAMCDMRSEKIIELTNERDEAIAFVETIAHDVSVLSTRPAAIIKFTDLVDRINEWGDAARNILDKKENTDD